MRKLQKMKKVLKSSKKVSFHLIDEGVVSDMVNYFEWFIQLSGAFYGSWENRRLLIVKIEIGNLSTSSTFFKSLCAYLMRA